MGPSTSGSKHEFLPSVDLVQLAQKTEGKLQCEDTKTLKKIEHRYCLYMTLVAENEGVRLVPPADVDEMLHLHILTGKPFAEDCLNHIGRLVEHSSAKVTRKELKSALDETKKLWAEKYGENPAYDHQNQVMSGDQVASLSSNAAYCSTMW